jgi:hypothetical protein
MGVGDLLDSARLKLEELLWEARRIVTAQAAQKRTKTYVLFGLAGITALILLIVVTTVVLNRAGGTPPETSEWFSSERIPREELFIPDEPDFLPPVQLYREQKKQWTAEDAAPFWTDPAVLDDDWRGKVEEYVDKLLERVP